MPNLEYYIIYIKKTQAYIKNRKSLLGIDKYILYMLLLY